MMQIERSDGNLDFLVKEKLIPYADCWQEGMVFVEVAQSLMNAGLKARFIEENNEAKSPDIEVVNPANKNRLFIEITKVGESVERKRKSQSYHRLFPVFHNAPVLPFSCKVLSPIPDEEFPNLINKIKGLKSEARDLNKMMIYSDCNINLAIASPQCRDELIRWANENNSGECDLVGLPVNFEDTLRIRDNKLKKKAKQIPDGMVGILYVEVSPLYFFVTDLTKAIEELESRLHSISNLFGVVLFSFIGNMPEEKLARDGMHFYSKRMLTKTLTRDLFFVHNSKCEYSVDDDTMKKLYSSFLI
ncbi:MAG: hypothetical protein ABJ313_09450 [Cyclobacteriaceae bacterium]